MCIKRLRVRYRSRINIDELSNQDQWLNRFFDILMVGIIPHFNTESLKPKGLKMDFGLNLENILLSK